MSRGVRSLGFFGIAGAVSLVLLVASPAESKAIYGSDGGRIGSLADGTGPDGGGTPTVLPAPRGPTLEDLVLLASHCAIGKDGAHTIIFELEFQPDGRLAELRFFYPKEGSTCVRAVFQHARVAPFTGPNRKVAGSVVLG